MVGWGVNKTEFFKKYLELIGDNPKRKGLQETPYRMERMFEEIFKGYNKKLKPSVTTFPNKKDGIYYDQLITDTSTYYSMCEHHCIPFFGHYFFGYIANKKVIGLSKVARVVDYYASKLQVQERLVKEIADEIQNTAKPLGLGIFITGNHLCKAMRGIKKEGMMTTCDLRGVFRTTAKDEFMQRVYASVKM